MIPNHEVTGSNPVRGTSNEAAQMRKRISDDTNRLLDQLHELESGWRARFRRGDLVATIRQIGEAGESVAVPSLLGFAFTKYADVRETAATAIRLLLQDVSPIDLAFLDQHVRQFSPWAYGRTRVAELKPDEVRRLDCASDNSPYVLGLASFHRSGYVRESATESLAGLTGGREVPFLLIRANDWVTQVRETASQALQARISSSEAAGFVSSLPLVDRLRDCGRADHEGLATAVETLLGSGEFDEELLTGLSSEDRLTRRACARIAVQRDRHTLCEKALTNTDPIVRVVAAKCLLTKWPADLACGLSARLAEDRFMAVRQQALRTAVERCPEGLQSRLESGLLDRSLSVRQLSAYYAKKLFDIEIAEFYRSRLSSCTGRLISACIMALGEYGEKEDAARLVGYVEDGAPSARRAAVGAIAALDLESNVDLVRDALRSELPGVSREASLAFQRQHAFADPTLLEDVFLNSPHQHVRRNAFRVLASLGKWPCLKYALLAVGSPDDDLVATGVQVLDRWVWNFNRSYATPTDSQVEEISTLLDSPCLQIAQERVKALRSYLPGGGS